MENKTKHIVLKTKDLSIGYKTKKEMTEVCSNINVELEQGKLIGLVGANGIGKSTLLRTLTRVQPALKGVIELNNKSLEQYTNIELAKTLSVVLTEQIASKNLSVLELVSLGRQPYTNWVGSLSENDKLMVNKAINQTKLEEIKHKKCYELSDGQMQKVMIARALAQDTDIIILDEPTTHLDMYHKTYILKLLKNITKETNKTILFSTHEIDLAIQLCDTMVVFSQEKVVTDSPSNLINNGIFETLFPSNLIRFDSHTKSFRINE